MEKLNWLKNFAGKLSAYAAKYGITDAEVKDMTDSVLYFAY